MFFQLVGVFVILLNIFGSVASEVATEVLDNAGEIVVAECELYLVPLKNPDYGRGLVAGKFIEEDVEIDRSVVLAIHADDCAKTQLSNYVFGSHEGGIAIAQLGLDMLYNHNDIATVTRTWAHGDLRMFEEQELPHATHTEVLIRTSKNVSGE